MFFAALLRHQVLGLQNECHNRVFWGQITLETSFEENLKILKVQGHSGSFWGHEV